jgi:hypothetical protein
MALDLPFRFGFDSVGNVPYYAIKDPASVVVTLYVSLVCKKQELARKFKGIVYVSIEWFHTAAFIQGKILFINQPKAHLLCQYRMTIGAMAMEGDNIL